MDRLNEHLVGFTLIVITLIGVQEISVLSSPVGGFIVSAIAFFSGVASYDGAA